MRKIGEEESSYSSEIVMRVQIFDRIFDTIPSENDVISMINKMRILPVLSTPIGQDSQYRRKAHRIPDSLNKERPFLYTPLIMSIKMEQYYKSPSYPKDELTYICTKEGPLNKQHKRSELVDDYRYWMWHDFHYQIGRKLAIWQGVEYDIIGDGTFEYPTREQQESIEASMTT